MESMKRSSEENIWKVLESYRKQELNNGDVFNRTVPRVIL
jgi:hypothetical protein